MPSERAVALSAEAMLVDGGPLAVGEDAGHRRDRRHEERANGEYLARGVRRMAEHGLHVEAQQEHRAERVAVEEPLHEERAAQHDVLHQEIDVEERLRHAPLQEHERREEH